MTGRDTYAEECAREPLTVTTSVDAPMVFLREGYVYVEIKNESDQARRMVNRRRKARASNTFETAAVAQALRSLSESRRARRLLPDLLATTPRNFQFVRSPPRSSFLRTLDARSAVLFGLLHPRRPQRRRSSFITVMTSTGSRPSSSTSSHSPVPSTSNLSKQPKTRKWPSFPARAQAWCRWAADGRRTADSVTPSPVFDHLSTLAALVPRSFDLNYPMYTYAHSDDAVPRFHQRSESGSSSGSSSSGLLTPPPASPLLAANGKGHYSIDDELDFGPPQGPAPAAWPSPELDLVRLPPPAQPEPAHKATPARKQLPVATSKSKSVPGSTLQLPPSASPALTRRTKASVPSRCVHLVSRALEHNADFSPTSVGPRRNHVDAAGGPESSGHPQSTMTASPSFARTMSARSEDHSRFSNVDAASAASASGVPSSKRPVCSGHRRR